ncbi:MAG: hypothetical protein WAU89_23335 [Candidatus Acidiferrales bacterium]
MGADALINTAKGLNPATQVGNAADSVEDSASSAVSAVGDAITSGAAKVASWFEPAPANATPDNNYAARKQQEDDEAYGRALVAAHPELDAANRPPAGAPTGPGQNGIPTAEQEALQQPAVDPTFVAADAISGGVAGGAATAAKAAANSVGFQAVQQGASNLTGLATQNPYVKGIAGIIAPIMLAVGLHHIGPSGEVVKEPIDIQGTSASSPNLPNTSEHFQALLDHPDATPELKSAVQSLKPAIRDPETGEVYLADDPNAKTHADVFADLPEDIANKSKLDTGFVGPDSEYMTRQQAADHLISAQATGTAPARPVTPEVMEGPVGASAVAKPVSAAAGGTEAAPAASGGSGADVASPAAPETFYHGSNKPIGKLLAASEVKSAEGENRFGPGLYTSNDPTVAQSYAFRGNEGKGQLVTYEVVKKNPDAKLLDLEQPAPPEIADRLFPPLTEAQRADTAPEVAQNYDQSMQAWRERPLRDFFTSSSTKNSPETNQLLQQTAKDAGYAGLEHIGGLSGSSDRVQIWFDPTKDIGLKPFNVMQHGNEPPPPAVNVATPAGAAQSLAERQIAALKAVRVGKGVAEEFGRPDIATEVPESLTMEESQALRQNLESYYAQGTTPPELPAHVQALASTYQEENQAIHAFNTDLRARAANGEDVSGDLDQLVNRWSAMAENYSTLAGQRTALGRGLQILDPNKPGNAFVAATSRLAQEVGLEDNPQRLSDLLASMTPDQYGRVGRQMASDVSLGRSLYNGLNEYYINNLLSDVGRTSSKIGVSNAVSGLLTLPTRAIAAAMPGSPFKFGEPLAGMQGMVDGFWHSVDVALESLKTGDRVSQMEGGATPFADDTPKAISAQGFGLGSTDPSTGDFSSSGIGKGVDYLGSVLRLPLRGLTAVHQFGHSMATSMAGHMLAWRDAIDTAASEGLDGSEGYSRAQEIYRQTLNDMPDPMRQAAAREADVTTFANQLEGKAASAQDILQLPVLKQFMPFFKVAYNIKKMGADMTPVVGQLTQASDVLYGSPAERSTALAKQGFGALMAIMIAHETSQGNITGDGPAPGAARDALMASGWRPNSIKMGDHYYGVPEPLAFPFSTIANYTELRDQMDDPTAFQKALAISQATGRAFANDSIVQGLVNLKTAWNAASTGDTKAWEKFAGQEASGMVPFSALLRAGARAQDPTIRNPSSIGQQIETGIPGMQSNVPPKYDIYGKPMIGMPGVPENLLYPVNVTRAGKLDKVDQAIVDTQANFERVPSYISGRAQKALDDPNDPDIGVPLTPDEQQKWAQLRGDGLKDQLKSLVDSPAFDSSSKLMKKQLLEFVGAKYSEVATLKLLQADPTLMARYVDRQRAKEMALVPPDALSPDAGATPESDAGVSP